MRLLDMVAYAAAALLGGEHALVSRGRGAAWRVVGCFCGDGPGLTGRSLAGASMLAFDTLVPLRLDASGDGAVQVRPALADDSAPPAVGYAGRAADHHDVLVVVERPSVGTPAEQRSRMAEVHAAAVDAVADTTENESRLRVGLEEREEERRRWARELHDETLQQLAALQVLLSAARRRSSGDAEPRDPDLLRAVDAAVDLVRGQIQGLRHLVTELRPAALDELGIQPPLHALAARTRQLTGLPVDMHVSLRFSEGDVGTRLVPDVELAVYRVVQEALTNTSRHSGASRAVVSVVELDGLVHVEVRDDGRGLTDARSLGFGLPGMRERAVLAGGALEVLTGEAAGEGVGTLVRMVVPAVHRDPEPSQGPGGPLATA
jgi:two-component system, NarL family, sensor histidine kinase DevS